MYWIYVLNCETRCDEILREYIGKTKRYNTRQIQHLGDRGANFTSAYPPNGLIVLYKVKRNIMYKEYSKLLQKFGSRTNLIRHYFKKSTLYNFFRKFDNDDYLIDDFNLNQESDLLENEITIVRNILNFKTYSKYIRGGKWHQDQHYHELEQKCSDFYFKRPLCHCGEYSEIDFRFDYLYFICPFQNYFVQQETGRKSCKFELRITENNNYFNNNWNPYNGISGDKTYYSELEYSESDECLFSDEN